ncbi:tetratricopeptide repeat protein [Fibrobacter sp. UWB7]|uniref:tetratricopeptide repeat protein n=1 Tax=Fibrobacter sp. UWB7 TaxID=1896206 RepID=UPI0009328298|nr:tetratricopeptide repeat protein [Fibrobacter sp. UWB7]
MMAVTLDSLRKAVKKNKGRSQALAWLADMERASGDYEAALKTVDAALAASPSDVPAMLVRARILAGQQDFAGSITEYKKVLAKDPFCLSAHKRMGESYDKLGKEVERNACFRRVHDMDPLDPFWKDEYDVLPEEDQTLVAPPMDDSSFTMDVSDDAENAEGGEDNIFANLAASLPNTDEEDNASMDDLRNSLNFASDEIARNPDGTEIPDFSGHVLNSSEVSSAISGILGGDDDLDVAESGEKTESATSSLFSHFSDEEEKLDVVEEPKSEDVAEEKSDDEFSLDSLDEPQESDEKSTNIDDAFSSLLGDDELPEEAPAAEQPVEQSAEEQPAEQVAESVAEDLGAPDEEPTDEENLIGSSDSGIPSTHMDFSDEEDAGEANLLDLDETPKSEDVKSEESTTNVDDAFSSLLGEDELPEENATAESSDNSDSEAEIALEEVVEPAAETTESTEETEEKPLEESVEDSFDNLFEKSAETEDNSELTLDEPAAEKKSDEDSFGSLFEKSADADFSLNDETPAEAENTAEPVAETLAAEEKSDEDSLGSLFEKSADADFSLDDETPAEAENSAEAVAETPAETEAALEKAPEFVPSESAENIASAEGLVPTSHMDFSDEEDLLKEGDEFVLNLDEETPAAKESTEAPVSESLEEPTAEEILEEPVAAEEPVAEKLEEPVNEAAAPATETAEEDTAAEEVDGAFDALFGDESQEATGAEIEEASVKDSVGDSFDSIFGKDEDLDLPEEKSEKSVAAEEPVAEKLEEPVAEPESAEPVAEEPAPSAELDSIDTEVSNAFKGLFDEDDSLPESDEPNNNGVDYLMSGDSDDEVAASLVENAEAPLSRGAVDLDDSLNTRTLADIYMEQGVYNKALEIYSDLAKKNPDDAEIKARLEEVEKLCREKFGEG